MSTIVDIMPNISPTGDFKKISDNDAYNNNNKVATLFNLLEYSEGSNSIFTEMGAFRELNKIPYSEHPDEIVANISNKISKFLNFGVSVDYSYADSDINKENVIIKLTINGLPGEISVGTKKVNGFIRLVNPKYIR